MKQELYERHLKWAREQSIDALIEEVKKRSNEIHRLMVRMTSGNVSHGAPSIRTYSQSIHADMKVIQENLAAREDIDF